MTRLRIEVHIEEIVLDGFAPGDRHRIADAVGRELRRLLAASPAPPWSGAETARLDAGAFDVRPGDGADAIGAGIARRIHRGLSS